MTQEAVIEGYTEFVSEAIARTSEEFSVSRALKSGGGPGGNIIDKLLKNSSRVNRTVVNPELERFRDRAFDQFGVLLAYAESDKDIDAYREEIVSRGPFEAELREDLSDERREEVITYMLGRYEAFVEAMTPILESPEDEFWDAILSELTADEAHDLVDEHFRYTQPLREYPDAFRLAVTVDPADILGPLGSVLASPFEVVYTDEAIRASTAAEEAVIEEAKKDIDAKFG